MFNEKLGKNTILKTSINLLNPPLGKINVKTDREREREKQIHGMPQKKNQVTNSDKTMHGKN